MQNLQNTVKGEDAMKLIITIPFEGNDLDEDAFRVFTREARLATGIEVAVGRAVKENSDVGRIFRLPAEKFTFEVVKG